MKYIKRFENINNNNDLPQKVEYNEIEHLFNKTSNFRKSEKDQLYSILKSNNKFYTSNMSVAFQYDNFYISIICCEDDYYIITCQHIINHPKYYLADEFYQVINWLENVNKYASTKINDW